MQKHRCYFLAMHLFAVVCVYGVMPWYLFLFFLLIFSLICSMKQRCVIKYTRAHLYHILPSTVFFRHMIILHYRDMITQKKQHICLFANNFSKQQWKALRRAIKMSGNNRGNTSGEFFNHIDM